MNTFFSALNRYLLDTTNNKCIGLNSFMHSHKYKDFGNSTVGYFWDSYLMRRDGKSFSVTTAREVSFFLGKESFSLDLLPKFCVFFTFTHLSLFVLPHCNTKSVSPAASPFFSFSIISLPLSKQQEINPTNCQKGIYHYNYRHTHKKPTYNQIDILRISDNFYRKFGYTQT